MDQLEQPSGSAPVPPKSGKRKWTRQRDWEEAETSVLLQCVNSPRFQKKKRNQYCTKWEAIAQQIRTRENRVDSDSAINAKRCSHRMKTLNGYFNRCKKEKKVGWSEVEWRKANGIVVNWWYDAIAKF
ncbi:hypothetical protein KC19_2G111100 [Ceratodon purpureus]|uniref:Myb/SANT-like DNA-binding domain-containing protein n=1 Tax=Ceratodon purpureus TaxID=3225 RepID=A0A8T0ISL5_CERPU|nr:hypothetical protein KC19_2G111100 [Ceratodon purpureus]